MAVEKVLDEDPAGFLSAKTKDNEPVKGVAKKETAVDPKKKGGLILFIRQIIDELKKVVAPTRSELTEYTIVVLVFVLVIMLFITGVDVLIGQGIMALFAK